jgi:hypothetical protein
MHPPLHVPSTVQYFLVRGGVRTYPPLLFPPTGAPFQKGARLWLQRFSVRCSKQQVIIVLFSTYTVILLNSCFGTVITLHLEGWET